MITAVNTCKAAAGVVVIAGGLVTAPPEPLTVSAHRVVVAVIDLVARETSAAVNTAGVAELMAKPAAVAASSVSDLDSGQYHSDSDYDSSSSSNDDSSSGSDNDSSSGSDNDSSNDSNDDSSSGSYDDSSNDSNDDILSSFFTSPAAGIVIGIGLALLAFAWPIAIPLALGALLLSASNFAPSGSTPAPAAARVNTPPSVAAVGVEPVTVPTASLDVEPSGEPAASSLSRSVAPIAATAGRTESRQPVTSRTVAPVGGRAGASATSAKPAPTASTALSPSRTTTTSARVASQNRPSAEVHDAVG